ncbi:MAG TPA: cysteine desulfurase family protein [Bryobacteraceae bacterium]|nr:cysteine desulfurase family protein [Bryobacteraceae bacterium]
MNRYYFDHNATTPVSEEVLGALLPVLREDFGNASSIHDYGRKAKSHVEEARRRVAALIGAPANDVVFTSGGTESDNLAVFGTVRNDPRPTKHVITTAIEHPAVLAACAQLEREGIEVTTVGVTPEGAVDPDDVRRALRPETVLVSVMHANNELGSVQPVAEIARIAHEAGALMHSDGVQALGKIPVDVGALGVDLYSLTGHKVYAPKGCGALYIRKGVPLGPVQFGGHHENGFRPGTVNVPGAVALGAACAWLQDNMASENARVAALRDHLEAALLDRIPDSGVNSARAPRTPNTANVWFDGISSEALLIALDLRGFAVSAGAACSSGATEPSHVLVALGLPAERARSCMRFSLGRLNDEAQVSALIDAIDSCVDRLRRMSPRYSHA